MAEELVDEKPLDEEPAELTDEDLDRIADTAIGALQDILKYFEVGEVTIDEYEGDEGELILDITGDDLAVLIGRHGKTLDALQFLVSAITVRTIGFRYPVIVTSKVTRAVSARSWNRLPVLPRTAQLARTAASSFVR